MNFIRGLHNLSALRRIDPNYRCVLTIGSFDGVHLGHQAILASLRAKADELGLPAMVMIFEPQPQEVVAADQAPARLTPFHEKVPLLFAHGADGVICLKFDNSLRHMRAEQFIAEVLVAGLGVKHLIVGDDFRFGYQLGGSFDLLQRVAPLYDYQVTNMHTLTQDNERISSTRIRVALAASDFALAEQLLTRPYSLSGRVLHGRKLGRTLGVPTANLRIRTPHPPIQGVFAVEVTIEDAEHAAGPRRRGAPPACAPIADAAPGADAAMQGVANLGVRPTLDGRTQWLEVHLLDRNENLYGRKIRVIFRHKIREEQYFPDLEQLAQQLQKDIVAAKAFFAGLAEKRMPNRQP